MLKSKQGIILGTMSAMLFLTDGFAETARLQYDSEGRRNPFIPLTATDVSMGVSTSSGMRLEGIIYDPAAQSYAVINGKTYKTGESFGDATIKQIQKKFVIISINKEDKTLWLREEERARAT